MTATILITGFGPFPGAPFNPTAPLVEQLARRRTPVLPHVRRVAHVFPTSYQAVDRELPALLARERPDALIMFGLAMPAPAPCRTQAGTSPPRARSSRAGAPRWPCTRPRSGSSRQCARPGYRQRSPAMPAAICATTSAGAPAKPPSGTASHGWWHSCMFRTCVGTRASRADGRFVSRRGYRSRSMISSAPARRSCALRCHVN
jgi:hypothetical protein